MAERLEQEQRLAELLTDYRRGHAMSLTSEDGHLVFTAYLSLLAAYEDRSKAFEDAAADCVRLEEKLEARDRAWVEAEKFDRQFGLALPGDSALAVLLGECDERLAAEAEDEQHAHAEHLREAREVEQHQEEKHGE